MSTTLLAGLAQRMMEHRRWVVVSDAALLERLVRERDEAAFAQLLDRHGGMVWNVCRRVLRDQHAAEDAFQATFLVLFRQAANIRKQASLGCWLHGVALRTALKLCREQAKTPAVRSNLEATPAPSMGMADDTAEFLDQELARLPGKYRLPLVLCYLEGRTKEETARCLGWPTGTVSGRLARGKALLKARLTRRGVAVAGGLTAAAAAPLPTSALAAARAVLASGSVTPAVLTLAGQVGRIMLAEKALRLVALTALLVLMIFTGVGLVKPWSVAAPSARAGDNDSAHDENEWWLVIRAAKDTLAIDPDGKTMRAIPHFSELAHPSPDRRYLAYEARAAEGLPTIVDTKDGQTRVEFVSPVREPDFSPWTADSRYYVFSQREKGVPQVMRLEAATRKVTPVTNDPLGADAPRNSARGHLAYRVFEPGSLKDPQSTIVVTKQGKKLWMLPPARYFDLRFSPDGKQLAVSRYHEILVFDADTGKAIDEFKGGAEVLLACPPGIGLFWRPDGNAIVEVTVAMAGLGLDDAVQEHKVGAWIVIPRQGPVRSGKLPAGYGLQGWVRALPEWQAAARPMERQDQPVRPLETWLLGDSPRGALAISPDGSVTRQANPRFTRDRISPNGKFIVRQVGQRWPFRLLLAPADRPTEEKLLAPVAFEFTWSPDNQVVVRSREDGLTAHDPATGIRKTLVPATEQPRQPAFTAAGELAYLKLRRRDGKLTYFDLVVRALTGKSDTLLEDRDLLSFAFSPDGKWLAIAEMDQVAFLDVATRQVKATFKVSDLKREWHSLGFHELFWRRDSMAVAGMPHFLGGVMLDAAGKPPIIPGTDHIFVIQPDGRGGLIKAPDEFQLRGWTTAPKP
jgi:RNA polymerase sigma factor (sigma-70 family)